MDSVRACSCEAVEIAHRQSQWLDCEALVPPRVRPSSACRASKKMVDLDRYRGPLTVLVGANFHSGDDFSIEGRTAGGRRKCMNSAKGRGFNTKCQTHRGLRDAEGARPSGPGEVVRIRWLSLFFVVKVG